MHNESNDCFFRTHWGGCARLPHLFVGSADSVISAEHKHLPVGRDDCARQVQVLRHVRVYHPAVTFHTVDLDFAESGTSEAFAASSDDPNEEKNFVDLLNEANASIT